MFSKSINAKNYGYSAITRGMYMSDSFIASSHKVLRTPSTLWSSPCNALVRNLDIAGFAVNAACFHVSKNSIKAPEYTNSLLRIDLEPHTQVLGLILNILVDPCGAESVLHTLVPRVLLLSMLVPILDVQVHWLVLFVIGACP